MHAWVMFQPFDGMFLPFDYRIGSKYRLNILEIDWKNNNA